MFTAAQLDALADKLKQSNVKDRKQGARKVSYVEGWHCIAEANRIFGFDGWTRRTTETRMVAEGERKIGDRGDKGWGVSYIARVEIVVFAGDTLITREGIGAGHGIDRDLGQAHESAIKEAETDAMKRALSTFGNQFGLALYDKTQEQVEDDRTYEQNEQTIDRWGERRGAELARGAAPPSAGNGAVVWDGDGGDPRRATASDFEATTGTLKASYLQSSRDLIRKATDADELRAWWFSEQSVKARQDFELNAVELGDLSRFCKAQIDKLKGV